VAFLPGERKNGGVLVGVEREDWFGVLVFGLTGFWDEGATVDFLRCLSFMGTFYRVMTE